MEYKCKICNKNYSSYQSRCNHMRKYHSFKSPQKCTQLSSISNKSSSNPPQKKILFCKFCNKNLSRIDNLKRHEEICKKKENKDKEDDIDEIEEIKKQNIQLKKEMEELKNLVQKSFKIHPKTLNKINNQLNSNNNNSNNTINQTINIVQLGRENLSDVLSEKQKISVLDRQAMSLNNLVELVHISGKFVKFQNVYITNLRSNFAFRYDEKYNKFITVNKNDLLTDILECRMYDIEQFYKEIHPKMEPKKANQIKKFIERMSNEEDSIKGLKREEITLILYNNKENIIASSDKLLHIKDVPKNTIKDTSKDVITSDPKNTIKDTSKDVITSDPKNTIKDTSKDVIIGNPKDTSKKEPKKKIIKVKESINL